MRETVTTGIIDINNKIIDSGLKSSEIADRLNISIHTVSRHRQEILAKLQEKNSIEACRLAKSMELI
ncbi:MAG: LuxR C-terminal-related transcriptional regulator [Muribaculaceae bacterium]|nr:LuxR C-terminal-related transcriptional regulator [Muribaculaceae bacterium]MDE6315500.1 LuxR C-terminal-related transcriptional regulator [Muribaculaceae bacterium]